MKKIALDDIRPPKIYERAREASRKRIIALKKLRRVALGPDVSVEFENRATMISQIEEMARAEHIEDPQKIRDEIDVYNSLLPDEGELTATLFVQIVEKEAIRATLARLVGLDAHVTLEVSGVVVRAEFEAGRSEGDRLSSVQYLRFKLPPEARRLLATPATEVALVSALPTYSHRVVLEDATRASLAEDLT